MHSVRAGTRRRVIGSASLGCRSKQCDEHQSIRRLPGQCESLGELVLRSCTEDIGLYSDLARGRRPHPVGVRDVERVRPREQTGSPADEDRGAAVSVEGRTRRGFSGQLVQPDRAVDDFDLGVGRAVGRYSVDPVDDGPAAAPVHGSCRRCAIRTRPGHGCSAGCPRVGFRAASTPSQSPPNLGLWLMKA